MTNVQIAAVLVLAGVALGALWVVRRRHRAFRIDQLILWYAAKLMVRILWRARQPAKWPIGRGQGAVVVCNHRSSIDPFFLQTACDRPMRWMVAREYCETKIVGWFLRVCNVIPVGRGGIDTAATKTAIRCASEGGIVGMLPEGRINTTEAFMLPVRPGAVLVALRARVPILPCYIEGSPYRGTVISPLVTRANVRVVYGNLIDLSEYHGRESESGLVGDLMRRIVKEIASLAGRADFEPQLAGRKWKSDEAVEAGKKELANGEPTSETSQDH